MSENKITIGVLLIILFCYGLTNYGGIRSPDNEIVFRTAESISSSLSFHVERQLSWQSFGFARGLDGRYYSIFGPLESILLAPLISIGKVINSTKWYEERQVTVSHYVNNGLKDFFANQRPEELEPHALRFVVSYLYILVSFFTVVIFFLITKRLFTSITSLTVTALYGLATISWAYSGTSFSEPLSTLLIIVSFYLLTKPQGEKSGMPLWIGLFLGLATMTHISNILFSPFFLYLIFSSRGNRKNRIMLFIIGFFIPLVFLGYYNLARFGNPFETGRTADLFGESRYIYSYFVPPWTGLYGLTLSGGKGLIIFCPIIIFAIATWRFFHKQNKSLSLVLIAMIACRILFIASRSDWTGGFCLGPRYLLPLIPFLVLPVGSWLDMQIIKKRSLITAGFLVFSFLCMIQQLYFNLGEIFSYYHVIKLKYARAGIDIFANQQIYLNWNLSPLLHILKGRIGPFLMQQSQSTGNVTLWLITLLISLAIIVLGIAIQRKMVSVESARNSRVDKV